MDEQLATRREFLLGRWLAEARAAAPSDAERDLFEHDARMLITTWSEHASDVRDYAYREWAGLLQGFYKPRWEVFFDALRAELAGRHRPTQDWFAWEWTWVQSRDHFPKEPRGDAIDIARRLQAKYQFPSSSTPEMPLTGDNRECTLTDEFASQRQARRGRWCDSGGTR